MVQKRRTTELRQKEEDKKIEFLEQGTLLTFNNSTYEAMVEQNATGEYFGINLEQSFSKHSQEHTILTLIDYLTENGFSFSIKLFDVLIFFKKNYS